MTHHVIYIHGRHVILIDLVILVIREKTPWPFWRSTGLRAVLSVDKVMMCSFSRVSSGKMVEDLSVYFPKRKSRKGVSENVFILQPERKQ